MPELKKKAKLFLICWVFGIFGVHRFMKKYWKSGLVWLFTLGLFGFGWMIDILWIIFDMELIFAQ
ncbi:MAG: NINE protein [Candidatus Heimdallarchaeota archaeon]